MFSDQKTLREAIEEDTLPVVVRTCEKCGSKGDDRGEQMEDGTLISIDRKETLDYMHIKVVGVNDEDESAKRYGSEFVYERAAYVGEEYLIPVRYPRKLSHVHRPGKRNKYTSVAQVLEDMPPFVRTEEDLVAVPPGGNGINAIIPAKTILQTKRRFKMETTDTELLQLTCGPITYTFSANAHVNFVESLDAKTYTLTELMQFKEFPVVIEFQDFYHTDIIHFDDTLASAMLLFIQGPIEILGTVQVEVLMGWVREHQMKTYQTVVIPVGLWDSLLVQRCLLDETLKAHFLKRKFAQCPDSEFVTEGLYMLKLSRSDIVWLKSPALFTHSSYGDSLKTALEIDFQVSTDEEDEGDDLYDSIPPPVPERVPVKKRPGTTTAQIQQDKSLEVVIQRKRTMFSSVHRQLLCWFKREKNKKKHSEPPTVNLPATTTTEQGDKIKVAGKQFDQKSNRATNEAPARRSEYVHVVQSHESDMCQVSIGQLPPRSYGKHPKTMHNTFLEPSKDQLGNWNTQLSPEEEYCDSSNDILTRHCTSEKSEATKWRNTTAQMMSHRYEALEFCNTKELMKAGQCRKHFYELSVQQVYYVFSQCSLTEIADACLEHRLDGKFFEEFDLDEMKSEPFNASKFHIMKVKQIIFNGWRPKVV